MTVRAAVRSGMTVGFAGSLAARHKSSFQLSVFNS